MPKARIASSRGTVWRLVTVPASRSVPAGCKSESTSGAAGPNQRAVMHLVLQIGMRTFSSNSTPADGLIGVAAAGEAEPPAGAAHGAELVLGRAEPAHHDFGSRPAAGPARPTSSARPAAASRSSGSGIVRIV